MRLRVRSLLVLLCCFAALRPACSGRGLLSAPGAAAAAPHLEAADRGSALKLRSLVPAASHVAAAQAEALHRVEAQRAATSLPALTLQPPPAPPAAPPLGDGAAKTAEVGEPAGPDTSHAPSLEDSEHTVRAAESDSDGIGTNETTRAAAEAEEAGAGGHREAPTADAAPSRPFGAQSASGAAPDAAMAAAMEAHAAAAAAFAAVRCPAGCTANGGNCDAERGSCDCPLGRGGPACETATLASCELFLGYVTPCGGQLTSCACLSACAAQLRVGPDWFNGETCLVADPPRTAAGLPISADDVAVLDAYMAGLQRRAGKVGDPWPVAPSADCGERGCGGAGVCRGAGRGCACLPGRAGPGCARREATPPCLNDCSGVGTCSANGFCVCRPGFWGDDCALSRQADDVATRLFSRLPHDPKNNATSPLLTLPPPALPAIFVYHMPPVCSAWWAPYEIDRPASEMLHERLAASAHRVTDATSASHFFVPLPLRKLQKAKAARETALACIAELAASFPHINATGGGKGHLLVTAGDLGPEEAFGRDSWAREGLPAAVRAWSLVTHHGATKQRGGDSSAEGAPPLFRPGRDVLLPPLQGPGSGFDAAASPLLGGPAAVERNVSLFWAGAVSRAAAHATKRNMRAAVYDAHRLEPGFVLLDTATAPRAPPGAYGALFASARFCLAPAGKGGGWGRRATLAALHGCVPVLLQDDTADALGELLAWDTFSVRVEEADVADLPAVLAAISPARLEAMQRELACAVPRWLWSSVLGAAGRLDADDDGAEDAIASLLQTLHRRELRAAGEAGAMPAAPCALRRARVEAGCTGAPLPAEGDERFRRALPAFWPAGGAACADAAPPCAVPRGAPQRCATDSAAAAGFLVNAPEWTSSAAV